MDSVESETSTLFTLSDSLAQQLFRDVPGEESAKYQSLNEHYFWPFDESMKVYERISHKWQQQMAGGALYYEPPSRKGEVAKALRASGKAGKGKVLDVGCGVLGLWPTDMAVAFPDCESIGIDLVPSEDEYAPPNLSWEIWDVAQGLPFRDNDFDAIRVSFMSAFLPDYPSLLSEALRCLKPNGVLLVSEPECVLHNDDLSVDWLVLQQSVSPTICVPSSTHYHVLKDLVLNAETKEWNNNGTGFTAPIKFSEVFEHELTMAVGSWPGLAPSDVKLGLIKRDIVLLLWRNRLLDPQANKAEVCRQLEIVERLVSDPRARVITRQKLLWARK